MVTIKTNLKMEKGKKDFWSGVALISLGLIVVVALFEVVSNIF